MMQREFGRYLDIDFAYPTQRFYDNRIEEKAGTIPLSSEKGVKTPENEEDQSTVKNRTMASDILSLNS